MTYIRLAIGAGALATLMSIGATSAQDQGILGIWSTKQNKSRVEIVNCAPPKQGLCGTIVWISQPNDAKGKPQTDRGNPNPALKNRPIIGLPLFEGWREAGRNKWKGSVYNPEEAQTYNNLDITLAGDRLTLKGCVAIFCDSETWNRYRGP
ncbi:MAG: DUF2147 domain-containing protein [Alphaproteobacteria bacterium]|jgi:uncharacterized protein (DUF2147 family)|nr:MAG: DUF2147 domain-containing protein [Alphaproteobacteria bacterium]